ncbi:MAG: hypothetical protein IJ206_11455 [Oscillospiraceae bacterium]|nr:hypothetical protein [Oscillospiraceae bacterium]
MTYTIYQLLGLFLIYSFLGWCTEVSFAALSRGVVVNRGFLNGPVCPIYGVGMIGVLLLLTPLSDHVLTLFLGGMVLCTLVELVGGWILKQVFDTRWWDYTDEPFNLGGYICLRFSILWGLAVTFVVKLVHPALLGMVNMMPHMLGVVLECLLYGLFLTDLVMTLVTIIGIKRRIREMERVAAALHAVGDTISDRLGNTALAADARLDEMKESGQEKVAEGKEKVAAVIGSGQEKMARGRQKLETKVSGTLEELQARRAQLEDKQKQLLAEYRSRRSFMTRRLGQAFPAIRQAIQEHLDNMDRNS